MQTRIAPWAFLLAVRDLERSAGYFRDIVGSRVSSQDVDDRRLVERDSVRATLGHCPTDMRSLDLSSHIPFGCFDVDDIDALHAEITAGGAICSASANRHYGTREVVVTAGDGDRIVFAQELREHFTLI